MSTRKPAGPTDAALAATRTKKVKTTQPKAASANVSESKSEPSPHPGASGPKKGADGNPPAPSENRRVVTREIVERLAEFRQGLFGERGGPEMARRLGIPVRTWYN
jgi:hypothetical protein